ncbi:MAG: hypothetical protein ACTHOE_08980 [Conexibacter sp.]
MRALSTGEAAWIVAIPAVALGLLAVVLLGPPLGRALLTPDPIRFFALFHEEVMPEPVEQARYLLAVGLPLLLAGGALLAGRRPSRSASLATDALAIGAQALVGGFAVLCLLQQHALLGPLYPTTGPQPRPIDYFNDKTIAVAALATLAAVPAIRRADVWRRLASLTRDTPARALVAGGIALVVLAMWLSQGFNAEDTIRGAHFQILYHLQFTMDETFAVLDHRSPLVNYAAQYGSLWPYPLALAMSLLGTTVGVWVTLASILTGLGMLGIYGVLRRTARSAIVGLLLFAPLVAVSFTEIHGTAVKRYSFENYFGTFPLRYAGPCLLAWLLARHLDGARPRARWPLLLAAGLVALNNADVGLGAAAATFVALLWAEGRPTRASFGRLVGAAAAGGAAAFALVSLLTLVRAGALPDLGLLMRFSRLFGLYGFAMFPMPRLGVHLAIYATFVGALGLATVRALQAEPDRLLTGMLAWSAVFGFGASAYFAGGSTPDNLPAVFFPWALALALLLIPAVRAIHAASWRTPPLAAIACLFFFAVMACSLAQTPTPWGQLDRLGQTYPPLLARPHGQAFVAARTHPGERVVVLGLLGHRVGFNVGVVNVLPYSNGLVIATPRQLDESLALLRAEGGSKVFVDTGIADTEIQHEVERAGFAFAGTEPRGRVGLWVDRRGG